MKDKILSHISLESTGKTISLFFDNMKSAHHSLKILFNRQELEGLDKLEGKYRVEEVQFKAEKREDTNLEEKEEAVVRLTEEEWAAQLASMTTREQREMERFLGERGDIRILENPGCSSKRSWRLDVEGVGTLFLPLRSGRLDAGHKTILVEPIVEDGRLKLSTKTFLKRVTTSKWKSMLVRHQEEEDQFWNSSDGFNLFWLCSRRMHAKNLTVTKMSKAVRIEQL